MRTDQFLLGFAYLRLSREEISERSKNEQTTGNHAQEQGESASITNQRAIIRRYCEQNDIVLVREFSDDGWSGGNFDRPGFREMMRQLELGKANTVITKDLSRLGRDMRESSYYAEQYFPEHGIRYIAINDNFDSEYDNIMAPFQFAMNEVYLRDGSRKVKEVLKNKREAGQYCTCPPYGYQKDPRDKSRLIPDEVTAPIVQRIFERAAHGDSSLRIAADLNCDGVLPPLKYRVLNRGTFTDAGAARASDLWNNTTVKRILKNRVYLGHTILGRTKKVSVKSEKKVPVPKDKWAVTNHTHQPLVSEETFERAQFNMGRATKDYRRYDHVRKSVFSGLVVCAKCGHALCSCGTVYKGEREKYWYLACNHQRQGLIDRCSGTRIRYQDLVELVRGDLNTLLSLDDDSIRQMMAGILKRLDSEDARKAKALKKEKAMARLKTIDKVVTKLYTDNAEGKLDDDRLARMVADLEREAGTLNTSLTQLNEKSEAETLVENYDRFFSLVKQFSTIDELDNETLRMFIDRIEVWPKEFDEGWEKATHNRHFHQRVDIYYRYIGKLQYAPNRSQTDNKTA